MSAIKTLLKISLKKNIHSYVESLQWSYTMPSTASFSLMEWRHFFHWATEEWTYTLEADIGTCPPLHHFKCVQNQTFQTHHPFWAPNHIVGRTLLIFWASSLIRSGSSALRFELIPSFSRSLSLSTGNNLLL